MCKAIDDFLCMHSTANPLYYRYGFERIFNNV